MEDFGLVSIITPTYNCGKFISETIDSVLAQTYTNWEMLIIDDCSSDNTEEVVSKYKDSRIKYHCLEQNSGAAVARNTALKMAKGQWIAFLDSDDLWKPEKLEHQLKFMVDNNYKFSCTERESIDENTKRIGVCTSGPTHINKFLMHCYCWLGCLGVMYDARTMGIIQIGDIKKNNDYAIWLRAINKADCYLLKENLAQYRVRDGSISNTSKFKLVKWHYKLFRDEMNYSPAVSFIWTAVNMICGLWKKIHYESKIKA